MSDNQPGSDSIQSRIESAITQAAEEAPEVETEVEVETEEPEEVEAVEAETEAEEIPEPSEDEPQEVEAAPSFETIDELAEALQMPVEDFLQNIKGKFKVAGEEGEISLAELQAGYQKDADYRKKTAELAEQKRAFETEREERNNEIKTRLDQTNVLIDNLNNQLLSEFNSVNWDDLRINNPGEYAARLQEFQGRQAQINQAQEAAKSENERLAKEQQEKQLEHFKKYLEEQQTLLLSAIPEWTNPDIAKAEQNELAEFLKGRGFTEQEVAQAADHRILKLAYDAWKVGQKAEKVDLTKNKVKKLPKLVKPGAKKDQQALEAKAQKDQRKAIKKGDKNALRQYLLNKV